MNFLPKQARIIHIENMTNREKLFELALEEGTISHQPGQFIMVSIFGIGEAPFSIASLPNEENRFELCIREVGNVTRALHRLPEGAKVWIRGPYGHPFPMKELKGKNLLFVAGGLGLAPLRSSILYALKYREEYGRLIILYGARVPSERLFIKDLELWGKRADVEFYETVDKAEGGWEGHVGVITILFPLFEIDPENTYLLSVGPPIMYRFVIREALKKGIKEDRIFLSLERRMKCGIGECGHCQISGVYCCKDGPVFHYPKVKLLEEAL